MVNGKPGPEGSSGIVFGSQAYLQSLSNLSRRAPGRFLPLSQNDSSQNPHSLHFTERKRAANSTLKWRGLPSQTRRSRRLKAAAQGETASSRTLRRIAAVPCGLTFVTFVQLLFHLSVSESGRRRDSSSFVTIFQVIWSVFKFFFMFYILFYVFFFLSFMPQWLFCRLSESTFSFEIMKKHIGFCRRLSFDPLKAGSFVLITLFALFISLVCHLSTPPQDCSPH